ncbi:MAG: class I SAM-dependent methyltransferase [Planctomycetota bacterium]
MKRTSLALFLLAPILAALAACAVDVPPKPPPPEASVRPGVNDRFLSADLDVQQLVDTFESESREVAVHRDAIVDALGLRPGMAVADVGAGTGLYLEPLVRAVGRFGRVYAVDIAPDLIGFIDERIRNEGLTIVETVLCTETSAELPPGSVDLVFSCDTYHHFEYPRSTLNSLHRAIRPGGWLAIVDFERIPGVSREWVLDHVRVGKDEVIAEIEAAGFTLHDEPVIEGLSENYLLRFRRE